MKKLLFVAVGLLCALNSLRAMSVKQPTFEELVGRAEQVVRVEVLDTQCVFKGEGADRRIVTLVKLRVEKVIVGEAPAEMEIELLGGKVGDEALEVAGMTKFQKGDRDILFVAGNGRLFCPLVAVNHGRFLLVPNEGRAGETVARSDARPLRSVAEISTPVGEPVLRSAAAAGAAPAGIAALSEGMSVEQFEASIVECHKALKKGGPGNSVK